MFEKLNKSRFPKKRIILHFLQMFALFLLYKAYKRPFHSLREPDAVVPHILHQMHRSESALTGPQRELMATCGKVNQHWQIIFWSDADLDRFVATHFLPKYHSWAALEPPIKKADVSRYMLMHVFGGVYLDTDVECVRALDGLVDARPEGAWVGGWPDPALLLSTRGAEFWLYMIDAALAAPPGAHVLDVSGPAGLRAAAQKYIQTHGSGVLAGQRQHWLDAPSQTAPHVASKRIGFVPNELLDPSACRDNLCSQSLCAYKFPESFTVHHCLGSWK